MDAARPTDSLSVRANALMAIAALLALGGAAPAAETKSSSEAKPDMAYIWDLSDLYPSPAQWSVAYDALKVRADKLDTYKSTLGHSAGDMHKALDAISDVHRALARLSTFASLRADEDSRIAENQERKQLAVALSTLVDEKTAWLAPEILSIGAAKVHEFETQDKGLAERHGFSLDNILRAAPHTLGEEAEGVLASVGTVLQQPNAIFDALTLANMPYPMVKLSDSTEVMLDQSAYEKYRSSGNRADRRKVFDAFWKAFSDYQDTLGASLTTQIMGDVFAAKARKYPNALSAALSPDNMPESVYRTLVAQAHAGLPTLHRYLRLRKRLLGITDDLAYYDGYPPMFHLANEPHFDVDDEKRIALDALAPFGAEYLDLMRKGFAGQWMNLYPHPGKANGAYMNGSAYDVHPYLLFNDNGDYESLSTFAHEWGHAVHTLLTTKNQPFEKSNYSTFIAESASIINEMLLSEYMVDHAKTRDEKLYYLGAALESIRTTFFRQVMFAEFELALHEELEKGNALSGERMSEIYCSLLKQYSGDAQGVMKIDPAYCIEWAYVPHFYYDFYVYQYATSMAGAAQFTDAIRKEGAPARERFLNMLRAGGSDYPYEIYKKAGIDMASPEPYRALIARMDRLMDQIEVLEKTH